MKGIEEFRHNGELVAVLIRREFMSREMSNHAKYISAKNLSLQFGVGHYPKNYVAPRHAHEKRESNARYEELIHLVRGRMRVDLYGKGKVKFKTVTMRGGDSIHLVSGGHGFKMLSPCKCIEIKQGPFTGEQNKTQF